VWRGLYVWAAPFALGAFFGAVWRRGDAVSVWDVGPKRSTVIIGIIYYRVFLVGLFMVSLVAHVLSAIRPFIMAIFCPSPANIVQLAIIGVVCLTVLLLKWKDLMVLPSLTKNHAAVHRAAARAGESGVLYVAVGGGGPR